MSRIIDNHPKIQSSKESKIENIVQIEGSAPEGFWRIGEIFKFVKNQDDQERAAKVRLSNKHTLERSLINLYHFEKKHARNTDINNPGIKTKGRPFNDIPKINKVDLLVSRSKRQAAINSRGKFMEKKLED